MKKRKEKNFLLTDNQDYPCVQGLVDLRSWG